MATAARSAPDLPIVVKDRRRRGFYIIDNDIIDHYGTALKAHGIAVYSALARFANQDGECFPSQSTIADRLGMSRMQVSREIDKLKTLHLIEVKPQFGPHGEQRANIYILCDVPPAELPVTHRYTGCNSELHPPVTTSDTGCNHQLPKQNIKKKTQTEQNPVEQQQPSHTQTDVVVAGSSLPTIVPEPTIVSANTPVLESNDDNSLSAALLAIGLAEPVAQRLAQNYSREHITQQLDYLKFLQAEAPEKVRSPRGWLRRAIEENYGPPDGYVSPGEQAQQEQARQMNEAWVDTLATETAQRQNQAAEVRVAFLQALQAEYGTTDTDRAVWKEVQQNLSYIGRPDIHELVASTEVLACAGNTILVGVDTDIELKKLSHPGIQAAIQRTLKYIMGHAVIPEFRVLPTGLNRLSMVPEGRGETEALSVKASFEA